MLDFTPPVLIARDPRFIRESVELCQLATTWSGDVPAGGVVVQEKIDGFRAVGIRGELLTRGGVPFGGVDHILRDLAVLQARFDVPMMFDGEFQVDGTLAATRRHFQGGCRYGDAGQLFLFDAVPLADWRADACPLPLTARLEQLRAAMDRCSLASVSMLSSALRASAQAVAGDAARVWARGSEGLVIKVPGSLYRRSRSSTWLKVKRVGVD